MSETIRLDGIDGIDRIVRRLSDPGVKSIASKHLNMALITLENGAKVRAPGDTGRLASSLTHEVRTAGSDLLGIVGSNVMYAPYQEYGTGLLYDGPGKGSGKRHWPPGAALETWARRHGFASGFLVARAIGRRGGLRPKRFLRGAWEQGKGAVIAEMNKILPEITKRMAGK